MSDQPPQRFEYQVRDHRFGELGTAPVLPVALHGSATISAPALLDSGAAMNVLPFALGRELGFIWEDGLSLPRLGGVFGSSPAFLNASLFQ